MQASTVYELTLISIVIVTAIYMHVYYLPQAPFAYTCAPGFDYNFL